MPDWFTHVLIAWMVCEVLKIDRKWRPLAYIGVLIPDLSKMFLVVDLFTETSSHWFFEPFHSILIPILTAGLLSQLFQNQKYAFGLFAGSAMLHMGTDILQGTINSGYYLLFPLMVKIPDFGFFPSDFIWLNYFVLIFAGPFIYYEVVRPYLCQRKDYIGRRPNP
jgi:hypothetical protein